MEGATIIIRYQKAKWQVVAPRRSLNLSRVLSMAVNPLASHPDQVVVTSRAKAGLDLMFVTLESGGSLSLFYCNFRSVGEPNPRAP